ncbi:SDR family oxidoreductase [Micromonospora sp. WMMA1363]|uniref:SDR family oxidoreductase n=1 Tax=Micromonospora sp. WMMA1363 TaxID=3053985 RepID=UPI00259C6CB1|nr:SDR family oxidoreductase [Micromonospora sp. WMMA1363]MDM4719734.1 SDR family oxidoreductase [Micromonospora sp. WMMA1363]
MTIRRWTVCCCGCTPRLLAVGVGRWLSTVFLISLALDEVPRLGVAYGLHTQPRRSEICFNFLGSFPLPHGDDLMLSVSRRRIGPARGPNNDRGHGLKLTARIRDGHLIADLSFAGRWYERGDMLEVCRATRRYALEAADVAPSADQILVERECSTGLLLQVPPALLDRPATPAVRHYHTVLLTGATGFIGSHLLHLLLTRTDARVLCVVRDGPDRPAADRLREAYGWHVPAERLDRYGDRVVVLAGDLAEPGFALDADVHDLLRRDVEAIYHVAGDTRLFGDHASFRRHNVDPVRVLIALAGTGHPKDLHHVSTLAVCGSGPAGGPVLFSEDSLNVGQDFLNEYERSKYEAERLVHEFVAEGGAGFIYRSGNVTGHSVSGRFQRNGGDNRLVQLLRGCVRLGRVPDIGTETVALSPVDIVAEGILEVSRSARLGGGTFHIDTDHRISYEEIFVALRELCCPLERDAAPSFAALFGRYLGEGDEAVALAHFWASRPERNVRYDHSRTRRTLSGLGVEFPASDRAWLRGYLTGLIRAGEFSAPEAGS